MRQSSKVEGTKIAQAAKDLNVTSVTIRRYLTEFNIETTSDENGIKVLPDQAMEELKEIRRLKEEGLTNPKVLEMLEESRLKPKEKPEPKGRRAAVKLKPEPAAKVKEKEAAKAPVEEEEEEAEAPPKQDKRRTARRVPKVEAEEATETEEPTQESTDTESGAEGEELADGRSKHSLTCQTCSKVFEHMNPRLRDCLDCYRAKRKERRRGGSDRHKNVIQHPLAQQAANKSAQQGATAEQQESIPQVREPRESREPRAPREPRESREFAPTPQPSRSVAQAPTAVAPAAVQRTAVRNYRKAIEETRQITGSLKRRLERPDLPEGERRWLEQIYAYQLILHQGWRHLADYKAATQQQGKSTDE